MHLLNLVYGWSHQREKDAVVETTKVAGAAHQRILVILVRVTVMAQETGDNMTIMLVVRETLSVAATIA